MFAAVIQKVKYDSLTKIPGKSSRSTEMLSGLPLLPYHD